MTVVALTNAFVYVAGHDFTADTNAARAEFTAAANDKTTFRSGGWREFNGGLKTVEFSMGGFWQSAAADSVDSESFASLATTDQVYTYGPSETEGGTAYMWQAGKFNYSLLEGGLGENAAFQLSCYGTSGVGAVRGQLAKALGTVSATGAIGTALELGNVGASQYLYGTLHLMGTAGTTITVVLESDDSGAFSSATTRATYGPLTATGGTWATRVAGALAETHYRLRVTAITGTWTVAGAIGIQ